MYSSYLYNNQFNPQQYVPLQNAPQQIAQPQVQSVIRVHGIEGAKAYNLPPNSSILLLDETQNVIWLKMTDGAGYPTISGYTITPVEQKIENDYSSLEERIKKIEEELANAKSNITNVKQSNSNRNQSK